MRVFPCTQEQRRISTVIRVRKIKNDQITHTSLWSNTKIKLKGIMNTLTCDEIHINGKPKREETQRIRKEKG